MTDFELPSTYDVDIEDNRHNVVGHLSCSHVQNITTIKSLYVANNYRSKGLMEMLVGKAEEYAKEQQAISIIAFCGPEPFSKDGQIPLDKEIAFYEKHGFVLDHYVMGVTPLMEKQLQQEVCV